MAMRYIDQIKAKALSTRSHKQKQPQEAAPVLTKEDEAFLHHVTSGSDESPPPAPPPPAAASEQEKGAKDPQVALMDGAQDIPLPMSPPEEVGETQRGLQAEDGKGVKSPEGKVTRSKSKSQNRWSSLIKLGRRKSVQESGATGESSSSKDANHTADVKAKKTGDLDDKDVKEEKEDLTDVLEGLNLSAVNNRVFSVSDETQELLRKFKLVFMDLIKGVPTAYDDLESLLTNGDQQLQKSYSHLPSFLQKLVEQLPEKMTEKLGPEILAAAAEKAGTSGVNMENAGKAAGAAQKMGFKAPSLKDLVGKPGAIAGMLRSIISFLQARFPAIVGMNVLWSLALFILLFVFWYCHKRGREVRLEKERLLTEQEVAQLEAEYAASGKATEGGLLSQTTTTAPEGASIDAVEAGVREVQQRALENNNQTQKENEKEGQEEAKGKGKTVEVYPGT